MWARLRLHTPQRGLSERISLRLGSWNWRWNEWIQEAWLVLRSEWLENIPCLEAEFHQHLRSSEHEAEGVVQHVLDAETMEGNVSDTLFTHSTTRFGWSQKFRFMIYPHEERLKPNGQVPTRSLRLFFNNSIGSAGESLALMAQSHYFGALFYFLIEVGALRFLARLCFFISSNFIAIHPWVVAFVTFELKCWTFWSHRNGKNNGFSVNASMWAMLFLHTLQRGFQDILSSGIVYGKTRESRKLESLLCSEWAIPSFLVYGYRWRIYIGRE